MIAHALALGLMTVLLIEAVRALHIVDEVRGILISSRQAMRVLAASDADDLAKERAARAGALAVLRHTLLFSVRAAIILAVALIPIAAATLLTPVTPRQILEVAMSWSGLVGLGLFALLYARLRRVDR